MPEAISRPGSAAGLLTIASETSVAGVVKAATHVKGLLDRARPETRAVKVVSVVASALPIVIVDETPFGGITPNEIKRDNNTHNKQTDD